MLQESEEAAVPRSPLVVPEETDDEQPDDRPNGRAAVWDLTRDIMKTVKNRDGSTREVRQAVLHVAHMIQAEQKDMLLATDVSFTFFDGTPQQKIVAEGTAGQATLFSDDETEKPILDATFSRNFVLRDNVRLDIFDSKGRSGNLLVEADTLIFEEQRIFCPLSDDGADRVTIRTGGMDISGRGMTVDTDGASFLFEKGIVIKGTKFRMSFLDITGKNQAAGKAAEPSEEDDTIIKEEKETEPIHITCDGPLLFKGERPDKSDPNDMSPVSKGELVFENNIRASRGPHSLFCDTLKLSLDKDEKGDFQLVNLLAESGDARVRSSSPDGTIECDLLRWWRTSDGTETHFEGSPQMQGFELPALSGDSKEGKPALYSLEAEKEVSISMSVQPDSVTPNVTIHLAGGGRIGPDDPETEDAFKVSGDDILIDLTEKEKKKKGEEGTQYEPGRIRISGNAVVEKEGRLSGNEIVLDLEYGPEGTVQILTLSGNAEVAQEGFSLQSNSLIVKMIPGFLTEITSSPAFYMTLALESLSWKKGDAATKKSGKISARGEGTVRLLWVESPYSREPSGEPNRSMTILGPFSFHIDLENDEKIDLVGRKSLNMATSHVDSELVSIIEVEEAVHILMEKKGSASSSLRCGKAYLHIADMANRPEENDSQTATNLIRRIKAFSNVVLYYGTSRLTCHSFDWNVPTDLLIAEGGDGPVVLEMEGTMKVTGRKFLLKPNREELTIFRPDAIFSEKKDDPAPEEPVKKSDKTVLEGIKR